MKAIICLMLALLACCPRPAAAGQTPQNIADALLAQVKARLPALLRGTEPLTDAIDLPMLQPAQSIAFGGLDDLPNKLPYKPDGALMDQLKADFADSGNLGNQPLNWSPQTGLGGIVDTEGTAECDDWDLFQATAGHTSIAPTPAVLAQNLCAESGQAGMLARVGRFGVAIAVSSPEDDLETGGPGATAVLTVAVQVWDKAAWTKPEQLQARLDYRLDPKPTYKFCDDEPCADAVKLGYRMAGAFEAFTGPRFNPVKLSAADSKTYAAMLAIAQNGDADSLPAAAQADDAGDATDPDEGDWDFGTASTLFPAYLDGQLVLGRIGHGQLAWREDPDWNIGFWSLDADGTDLDPIAGFIFSHRNPTLDAVTINSDWTPAN